MCFLNKVIIIQEANQPNVLVQHPSCDLRWFNSALLWHTGRTSLPVNETLWNRPCLWFGSRTFQVPVIQLENVLEQEGGEQLQASDTVVLGTGGGEETDDVGEQCYVIIQFRQKL